MKLMKRVTALFLCFLMLTSGTISAFATESVSDNDVVVETTTTTETEASCEECGGSDAHTDTCSFNIVAPLTTETPTVTTGPAITPTEATTETTSETTEGTEEITEAVTEPTEPIEEHTELANSSVSGNDTNIDQLTTASVDKTYVGRYIAFNSSGLVTIYKEVDGQGFNTMSSVLSGEFIALYQHTGENGAVWYELDSSDWPSSYTDYKFVKADDITLGDSVVEGDKNTAVTGSVGNCTVTVGGDMPSDAVLELVDVDENELDLVAYGQENLDTVVAAIDIKVITADGAEWQPAEGKTATITLDAAALGLSDGMPVNIHHEHNGTVSLLGEFTVVDGKLTFTTDGFSIFTVTGLWGVATSTDVNELTMYVGETIYLREDNYNSNDWQVQNNNNSIISIATYTKPDGYEPRQSYCMVTANRTGTVTLSCGNNNSVTITVIEKPAESYTVKIDDQIYTNGCLVPNLGDATLSGITYKWYKNANLDGTGDYTEVTDEAISSVYAVNGGVNVAVDQGGKCWYKVEAYNADGELIGTSDPYWVPYSNELENGSFETPQIEGYNPFNNWGDGNVQFNQDDSRYVTTAQNVINGTALWWRTTGYGSINGADGRDIEIVKPSNTNSIGQTGYYVNPADQLQYAELNCETIGTLYQDVLTAPDTTLTWSFSHRGREGTDTMAAVIMPANMADEYAGRLAAATTTDAINAILDEIRDIHGAQVWDNLTAGNNAWTTHSGTYTTVDGQYLSRFFFVSVSSASGSRTMGNFIDGVSFDDKLTYTIRYYVDGDLQESETAKVKPYTTVAASKTGNYSEYALDKVVKAVNGVEDLSWGSTSMKVEANGTYLDLHYVTTGISITKKVVIDNTDGSMTADEVEVAQKDIWGSFGTAKFELKDASGNTVANAEVSVNSETGEGVALFVDGNGNKFQPEHNETYTIVETSSHEKLGYIWIQSQNVVVTVGNNSLAASAEYINTYKTGFVNLTITKEGSQSIDENQSFIFTVEGMGIKLDVVINGNGSVTIQDLPIGEYTVTENTAWSWRYTPVNGNQTITLTANGENTVSFSNKRSWIYWLSGDSYHENQFTVKSKDEEN